MQTAVLKINGMTCGHCAQTVRRALIGVRGVKEATVNLDAAQANVTFDPGQTTLTALREAVAEEGYDAAAVE